MQPIINKTLPLWQYNHQKEKLELQQHTVSNLIQTINQFKADIHTKISNSSNDSQNNNQLQCFVVSICGEYRTGKSFLINTLMQSFLSDNPLIKQQQIQPFKITNSVLGCKSGIQLQFVPYLYRSNIVNASTSYQLIIFIDSEGFNNPEIPNPYQHSVMISVLLALISDVLIYNSIGNIDEGGMDRVSLIAAKIRELQNKQQDKGLAQFTIAKLIWVLRDWSLKWNNLSSNQQISPNTVTNSHQYLEHLLDHKNYQNIKKVFKNRDCVSMVRPSSQQNQLSLQNIPISYYPTLIRPQFKTELSQLFDIITTKTAKRQYNIFNASQVNRLHKNLTHYTQIINNMFNTSQSKIENWNIMPDHQKYLQQQENLEQQIVAKLKKVISENKSTKKLIQDKDLQKVDKIIHKRIYQLVNVTKDGPHSCEEQERIIFMIQMYNDIKRKIIGCENIKKLQVIMKQEFEKDYYLLYQNTFIDIFGHDSNGNHWDDAFLCTRIQQFVQNMRKKSHTLFSSFLYQPQKFFCFESSDKKYSAKYLNYDLIKESIISMLKNVQQKWLLNKIIKQVYPKILNKRHEQLLKNWQKKYNREYEKKLKKMLSQSQKNSLQNTKKQLQKQAAKNKNIIHQKQEQYGRIIKRMQQLYTILKNQYQTKCSKFSEQQEALENISKELSNALNQVNTEKEEKNRLNKMIIDLKNQHQLELNRTQIMNSSQQEKIVKLLRSGYEQKQELISTHKIQVQQLEKEKQKEKIRMETAHKQQQEQIKQYYEQILKQAQSNYKQSFSSLQKHTKQKMNSLQTQRDQLLIQISNLKAQHFEEQKQGQVSRQIISQQRIKNSEVINKLEVEKQKINRQNREYRVGMEEVIQRMENQLERNRISVEKAVIAKYDAIIVEHQKDKQSLAEINQTLRDQIKELKNEIKVLAAQINEKNNKILGISLAQNITIKQSKGKDNQNSVEYEELKKQYGNIVKQMCMLHEEYKHILHLKNYEIAQLQQCVQMIQKDRDNFEGKKKQVKLNIGNKLNINCAKNDMKGNERIEQLMRQNQRYRQQIASIREKEGKGQKNLHKIMKKLRLQFQPIPAKQNPVNTKQQIPTKQTNNLKYDNKSGYYNQILAQKNQQLRILQARLTHITEQNRIKECTYQQFVHRSRKQFEQTLGNYEKQLNQRNIEKEQLYAQYISIRESKERAQQQREVMKDIIQELKAQYEVLLGQKQIIQTKLKDFQSHIQSQKADEQQYAHFKAKLQRAESKLLLKSAYKNQNKQISCSTFPSFNESKHQKYQTIIDNLFAV